MEFGVLGPLRVVGADGGAVDIRSPKLRTLLAVLLSRAGEVVSRAELADALWPERAPKNLTDALQVCVHRLRKQLNSPERIAFRADGYAVELGSGELDWHRFGDGVRVARAARGDGRQEEAREAFRAAVAHWRGRPFSEFDDVAVLTASSRAMTEQYVAVMEELAELDLALGHTADVVAGMRSLTLEHPFRERAHELLMLALVRAGCPGESLSHYEQLRELLAADLGTDPSDRLRRLHMRILTEDPELLGGNDIPRQLPPLSRLFAGRDAELDAVTRAIDERAVVAITGPGGVGKTTLALAWAHRHADRFPDGQLHLNLRGFAPSDRPMTTAEALRSLLVSLGVDEPPDSLDALTGLYRSLVADRRMVVVLDNARDSDQVAALLPGGSSCAAIVTSRHQLTALVAANGARVLPLRGVDDATARRVLAGHIGHERVRAEPAAVDEVVRRCAGLPLALAIVAARAAVNPELRLVSLAEELRDDAARLDALRTDELSADLRVVLAASWRALDADTAGLLDLLGLAPGADMSLSAVAHLAGRPLGQTRALVHRLSAVHLAHRDAAGRVVLHDLVRLYAAERGHPAADAALARLRDFYLYTAYRAERLLDPHRPGIEMPAWGAPEPLGEAGPWLAADGPGVGVSAGAEPEPVGEAGRRLAADRPGVGVPAGGESEPLGTAGEAGRRVAADRPGIEMPGGVAPEPLGEAGRWLAADGPGVGVPAGVQPEPLATAEEAMRWFTAEHHNLLSQLRVSPDRPRWLLAWSLHTFHWRRGYLAEGLASWQAALDAAARIGDPAMRARAHRRVAAACVRVGRHADALAHARAALVLFEEIGDIAGQARTHEAFAWIAEHQGEREAAVTHAERALELHRLVGDPHRVANALNSAGYYRSRLGEFDEAASACASALAAHRELGYRDGEAYALDTLGSVARAAGRPQEALDWYAQALPVLIELDDTYQAADTLTCLGELNAELGRMEEAHQAWDQALALYQTQRRDAEAERVRGLRG